MIFLINLFIFFSTLIFASASRANDTCHNYYSVNLDKKIQKIEHLKRLAKDLAPKLSPQDVKRLYEQAEIHIKELETYFGEYPSLQRKQLVEDFLFGSVFPKYKVLYHSANSKQDMNSDSSFAAEFNAIDFKVDNKMASAFQNSKLNIADSVFFKVLNQPKYNNAIPLDSKEVHTLVIEQVDKDALSDTYKKSQASTRILERTEHNLTVIERFAQNNKIESSKLKAFFSRIEKKDATIFELSRVSNGTGNKKIMSALKALIHHYFLKNDESKFLIISVSNPELISYYQRWGFEVLDELKDPTSGKPFTIMIVSGDKFQTSEVK